MCDNYNTQENCGDHDLVIVDVFFKYKVKLTDVDQCYIACYYKKTMVHLVISLFCGYIVLNV